MFQGHEVAGTYIEMSVIATRETEEAVADFLFSEGALGLVTEDLSGHGATILLRASFPSGTPIAFLREELHRYQSSLAALGLPVADGKIEVRELPVEDWGQNWKQHFKPLPVGQRLLITPPWEHGPFRQDRLVLCIEPAMAFGTGHHSTTRMCLETLEEVLAHWSGEDGPSVLDVGAGTGILAIAAAALGARRVVALDTDPEACEAARQNFVLNRMEERILVSCGGIDVLEGGLPFDLILANLDTKTLCPLLDALRGRIAPGGRLIASGIPITDENKVSKVARAALLSTLSRRAEDDWLCLTLAST